jgi:hypothetical protein
MAGDKPVLPGGEENRRQDDPWRLNEIVRRRRLREQGRKTPAENLDEAFALIRFVSSFTGRART